MLTAIPTIKKYVNHLKTLTDMAEDSIRRHEKFLRRVENALKKPILSVERGSEINEIIYKIVSTKKNAYNGGKPDPTGADLKFRFGKAVAYYVTWAHTENFIPRNFYPKNPFPKPHMTEAYYLTEERIWFLYKYEGFDLKSKAIIRFLIDTGVRVSELCRVKIAHADFDKGVVSIYMSKVKRTKEVPIMESTVKSLKEMLKKRAVQSEYLFCIEKHGGYNKKNGEKLSTHAVRYRLKKIGDKIGFRINPHSFRHGIATIWYKKFGVLPTARLLGHIDLKYTAHYAHILVADLRQMQKEILPKESSILVSQMN